MIFFEYFRWWSTPVNNHEHKYSIFFNHEHEYSIFFQGSMMIFEEVFWSVWHTVNRPVCSTHNYTWLLAAGILPLKFSNLDWPSCGSSVDTSTQLLSLKLKFKLKSNFSCVGKEVPNFLICKDQVHKFSDSSGQCWLMSLHPLYDAMHYSQNWPVATLSSLRGRKVTNYSFLSLFALILGKNKKNFDILPLKRVKF